MKHRLRNERERWSEGQRESNNEGKIRSRQTETADGERDRLKKQKERSTEEIKG